MVSIKPKQVLNDEGTYDSVIEEDQLELSKDVQALIIRTLPNDDGKKSKNYSNTNPVYLDVNCAQKIIDQGIDHLLVDLPSVDRESDNGELAFHHAFWEVPQSPNFERTITELIFVKSGIQDGNYILNFQVAPFENDASPSRPVLYKITKA